MTGNEFRCKSLALQAKSLKYQAEALHWNHIISVWNIILIGIIGTIITGLGLWLHYRDTQLSKKQYQGHINSDTTYQSQQFRSEIFLKSKHITDNPHNKRKINNSIVKILMNTGKYDFDSVVQYNLSKVPPNIKDDVKKLVYREKLKEVFLDLLAWDKIIESNNFNYQLLYKEIGLEYFKLLNNNKVFLKHLISYSSEFKLCYTVYREIKGSAKHD